ncbi:MAG: tetratricopeptide repeat protein [Planctomycetota bacterium]|nr:tetratricopeptide repeat protein [Planctomycetota bacterium]
MSTLSQTPSPPSSPQTAAPPSRVWLNPLLVFLLALLVRGLYLLQFRHSPIFPYLSGDSVAYDQWARQIAAGDWIGHDAFYQAPLYPYFLGLVYATLGDGLTTVRIVQALLGAVACALLCLAGQRLHSRLAGLVAGTLLAVYPTAYFLDALLQKSVLDTFLLCLLLALFAHNTAHNTARDTSPDARPNPTPADHARWLAIGAVTGLLALTRENALVFAPILALWIILSKQLPTRRRRAVRLALFALGLLLVLGPVAARNRAMGGGWQVTTAQAGPNLYIGNGPQANGTYVPLRAGRSSYIYERRDATEIAEAELGRRLDPNEVNRHWTAKTFRAIADDPGRWLALMGRKAMLVWNRIELVDTDDQEAYGQWSSLLRWSSALLHFGTLVPLAALGIALTWRRPGLWPIGGLAAAYALSLVCFYVVARYRFPLVPLLITFAAAGVAELVERVRSGGGGGDGDSPRRFLIAGAALVVAAIASNITIWPHAAEQAAGQHSVGYILLNVGKRPHDALPFLRRAVELHPPFSEARLTLGDALAQTGDKEGAVQQYLEAAKTDPNYLEPRYRLARAAAVRGWHDDAIGIYSDLIKEETRPTRAHGELGLLLASLGRLDEAANHLRQAAALDDHLAMPHLDLVPILLQQGKPDEALAHARKAVALEPALAQAHNTLGAALAQTGELDAAIAEFHEALKLDPHDQDANQNLLNALSLRGKSAKP